MIFYCTNKPDRHPPKLFGIIQCVSGGVEETVPYPSAAKVVFRYLGRTVSEIRSNAASDIRATLESSNAEEDLAGLLKKAVPRYVYPEEETEKEILRILEIIDNQMPVASLPNALRMEE
jgi:hypothetical protein